MSSIKLNTDCICLGHLASNAGYYKKTANQSARTIVAIYHYVLPCVAMYSHVLPCIAMYCHVLLFIIYILRNTPQKAIFVRKLVLANQRSERWFSHVKKMIRPIRIANDVFSGVRKVIRPIRGHRGVQVSRQNSRLLLQLAAPLRTRSTRKVLLKEFFSLKK